VLETGAEPEARTVPAQDNKPGAGVDTLRLWNRLKRTDPKATKPFQRSGGFRGTQIDPTWRLQMMTELFGPIGQGWGYEQLDWTIAERMVFICVRAWWRDPVTAEIHYTGPQWGGTEMIRRRRDGVEAPDDECFKMSMTDALGKCLVQLGLGADIHMGQFDDSKYREESEAYFNAKANPDTQPAAVAKFEAEIKERLAAVDTLDGLDELWRGGVGQRLRDIGLVDKAAQMRIVSYFSQRKAEIQRGELEAGAKSAEMEAA
jgi:hypothetical protein